VPPPRHPARNAHGSSTSNVQPDQPSPFTTGVTQLATPGRRPESRRLSTRAQRVGTPLRRSRVPLPSETRMTGKNEEVDSMDVELPQDTNDALTPTTTHQGSVASLPTPRAETGEANQQAPQVQASIMTRSRARNAAVFSAVAPPTAHQTGSILATLETGPRSALALQLPSTA